MRIFAATAAMTVGLFVGVAQADTITEACAAVVADSLMVGNVHPIEVQSFPELVPPRVTMTFAMAEGGKVEPSAVRCEFSSQNRPVGLERYCVADICLDEQSGASRLEEHRTLLKRRGF